MKHALGKQANVGGRADHVLFIPLVYSFSLPYQSKALVTSRARVRRRSISMVPP